MIIRTGILCIPQLDEDAVNQVRQLLQSHLSNIVILEESSARSQRNWVEEILRRWADEEEISLILTIGGTLPAPGTSGREIVPEATLAVIDSALPALPEAMRAYASEQTDLALLDRGVAGIRSRSLIINLPNGAAAAHLFLDGIVTILKPLLAHLNDQPEAPEIGRDLEIISNPPLTPSIADSYNHDEEKPPIETAEPKSSRKSLDPAEFAEFLKRKQAK